MEWQQGLHLEIYTKLEYNFVSGLHFASLSLIVSGRAKSYRLRRFAIDVIEKAKVQTLADVILSRLKQHAQIVCVGRRFSMRATAMVRK